RTKSDSIPKPTPSLSHTRRAAAKVSPPARSWRRKRLSANRAYTNSRNCFLARRRVAAGRKNQSAIRILQPAIERGDKMANLDQLKDCGTTIILPFKQDESIDESAYRRLVEFQDENGVDFIVACGTTGESVTMSEDEQARVVELTIEASEGRVPVVAGAGGYNTREVAEKARRYERLGAEDRKSTRLNSSH